jgi:hypothetical protein
MGWTITIGRVAGTEIKVHLTFFILVAFWAMAGYQQGGPAGAFAACIMLFALFACVLLHEFGHILMAGRFGVRTPDVILLPIGGASRTSPGRSCSSRSPGPRSRSRSWSCCPPFSHSAAMHPGWASWIRTARSWRR